MLSLLFFSISLCIFGSALDCNLENITFGAKFGEPKCLIWWWWVWRVSADIVVMARICNIRFTFVHDWFQMVKYGSRYELNPLHMDRRNLYIFLFFFFCVHLDGTLNSFCWYFWLKRKITFSCDICRKLEILIQMTKDKLWS
jgi:hypothetical protein